MGSASEFGRAPESPAALCSASAQVYSQSTRTSAHERLGVTRGVMGRVALPLPRRAPRGQTRPRPPRPLAGHSATPRGVVLKRLAPTKRGVRPGAKLQGMVVREGGRPA